MDWQDGGKGTRFQTWWQGRWGQGSLQPVCVEEEAVVGEQREAREEDPWHAQFGQVRWDQILKTLKD